MTTALASLGQSILDRAAALAAHSDMEDGLTCAYLTPAHRRAQAQLVQWMETAGMAVRVDAIGNVIGRYAADPAVAAPKVLMTGSHFDTVRNGGRYDGRLGILLPIAVVARSTRRVSGCRITSRSSASPRRKGCASRPASWPAACWRAASTRPCWTARTRTA